MATVTKPIALDESLNTTELSSRNVADVLAQELSAVATAIGGITHPDAEDIVYDNTSSGLTATNVQDAIDEVEGNIPTALSELSDDSTHRLVTDSEKAEWNATTPTDTTDDEPYVIRQGKGNQVDFSLEGASVAWNQLVNGSNSGIVNAVSKSYNSTTGEVTCTPTDYSSKSAGLYYFNTLVKNHIMLQMADIKATATCYGRMGNDYNVKSISVGTSYQRFSALFNSSGMTSVIYMNMSASGWDSGNFTIKNVQCIDLTQLFGTTIADAIYSMEQSTSGSGVAFFRKYFPKAYYAYDTGSIQSVCVSERKVYDSDNNLVANYPIPTTQLRGLFSLVNGKLKANGDVLRSDGSGMRKYGIFNLGDYTYDYYSTEGHKTFRTIISNLKLAPSATTSPMIVCAKYVTDTPNNVYNNVADKIISLSASTQGQLIIYDSSYTDATAFKSAMNGVYLVAELATPTSISTTPFQNPQRAYPDGTEEFVDGLTRDVIVPVGNNSTYTTSDVLASADDYTDGMGKMLLPISAVGTDESGRTTASRAYTTGEFFYKDGKMYKVLTSIASGATFTVGTNISETTLFAELTALA